MDQDIKNMSRQELKALAKQRLRQPEIARPLMIAAALPLLIFALIGVYVVAFDPGSTIANITSMSDTAIMQASMEESRRSMLESAMTTLSTIFFTTGLALSALDVIRRPDTKITAPGTWLRLFNGRYFWAVLATAILTRVAISIGTMLLIIPGIMLTYGLSMVYFVLYDKKESGAQRLDLFNLLADTYRLTRGHKFDIFVLGLSFFGWYIVGFITMGIGLIWIYPYVQLTTAAYYEQLRQQYALKQGSAA